MISHNLEDSMQIATRFIVIAGGQIVYDGDPDRLMNGLIPESTLLGIPSRC